MEKYNDINIKLKEIFNKISTNLFILFIIPIGMFMPFIGVSVELIESPEFVFFNLYWIIFFAVHCLLLYFLYKNRENIQEKHLFLAFSFAYLLFATFYLVNISSEIRADAKTMYIGSRTIKDGNYWLLKPDVYLSYYTHQIGLYWYDFLLISIVDSTKFIFFVNFIQLFVINYFMYKIVNHISKGNRTLNLFTIYLSFSFIPQLFFISFAYGLIPGFCFVTVATYYMLRYEESSSKKDLSISIIAFVIACLIKSNYFIAAIAAIIHLWMKSKEVKKVAIYFAALVLVNFSVVKIMMFTTEKLSGYPVNKTAPKILWVGMGTDPDNEMFGPGWYNFYVTKTLKSVNYDVNKAKELGKKKVAENFTKHIQNPAKSVSFFTRKFATTWMDPTYQSIWSGPLEKFSKGNKSEIIKSVYNYENGYWLVYNNMKAMQILIYAGAIYYIFKKSKNNEDYTIFIVYIIGGSIFHLFWETKSQYVYPFVFMLIPLVSLSLKDFIENGVIKKIAIQEVEKESDVI